MGDNALPYILIILAMLILSAFFSATETAFTSLNRIRLKNMAQSGDKRAKHALELSEKYDKLLSTILVGNNIANILNTVVSTLFFVMLFGSYGATISTIVTTIIVLIFGEISPKTLAKENPEKFAMFSAPLIHGLMVVFTPINWFFSMWKKFLGLISKGGETRGITEDELITIVEEAETEGNILTEHSELIQNAIEFDEIQAWDVITPRVDIEAFELNADNEEIAKHFFETGFSRLPVYEEDLDKIIGVLNQKDFYNYIYNKDGKLDEYIKPVEFVAGSMKAFSLLKKMQHDKCQVAIVVDEYGGTEGLITMEDIIEEIVGEIYDEHEKPEQSDVIPLQDGSYRVRGLANVEKVFDYFDEEIDTEATTVNGWAIILLDKLPEIGDKFSFDSGDKIFTGLVTKVDAHKATEINLKVEARPDEE